MRFEDYLKAQFLPAQPLSVLGNVQGDLPTLTPLDLPEFDTGCQAFRQRRIKELEWELADLRRQVGAQDTIDLLVENILRTSFAIGGDRD